MRASSNFMESGNGNIGDNLGIQLASVNELLVMESKNEGSPRYCREERPHVLKEYVCIEVVEKGTLRNKLLQLSSSLKNKYSIF